MSIITNWWLPHKKSLYRLEPNVLKILPLFFPEFLIISPIILESSLLFHNNAHLVYYLYFKDTDVSLAE